MIKKIITICFCIIFSAITLSSCTTSKKTPKIGVSLGGSSATRWDKDKLYMEERGKELGVDIEVRLNRTDKDELQIKDCIELIDSGINVLILMPKNAFDSKKVLDYAKKNNVKVISYSRVIHNEKVDLYVGYDTYRIGQRMGQFLTDMITEGNVIILRGDASDNNAKMIYEGGKRYIDTIKDNINIILDVNVPNWKPAEAKILVREALENNDNKINAIFASNDKLAGASIEVLQELGITNKVIVTGMDCELAAIKRILAGTQSMTTYMDFKLLAETAVNEAVHMAKNEKVNVNSEITTNKGDIINGIVVNAHLIAGQVVTKENIDRILIDSGYFTYEEVYGKQK